jgi:hypothetical protein
LFISSLFPYFEKIKVSLWDNYAVCDPPPQINFWMRPPILMKLGLYVMLPEPISTAYFINLSHQPVYVVAT